LYGSKLFDPRLKEITLKVVDIPYGGKRGLHTAIDTAADVLQGVQLIRDRAAIALFMDEVGKDNGKFCIGADHTLEALQAGAAQIVIVNEVLSLQRYVVRQDGGSSPNKIVCMKESEMIKHMAQADAVNGKDSKGKGKEKVDPSHHIPMEVVESMPLVDWLAENCRSMGAKLFLVHDNFPEGSQFCKGFGGLGAILRYHIAFEDPEEDEFENGYDSDENDSDGDEQEVPSYGSVTHTELAMAGSSSSYGSTSVLVLEEESDDEENGAM